MKSIIAVMLFPSVGQAALEAIASSPSSGSSSLSFNVVVTGTQTNGFGAGGLSSGAIVTGVSADGQVIVDAVPASQATLNPPNLVSVARSPSSPTTSK